MMNGFQRFKFKELPASLQSQLAEPDFLRACAASDRRNIIVWMIDRKDNRRIELEWNPSKNGFASHAERLASLDPPSEIALPGGERAKIRHILSPDTGSLTEDISVFSADGGPQILHASQDLYSPARIAVAEFIQRELERADFPQQYAGWPDDRKIGYWVATLHRLRRSAGENGKAEDEAFGAEVVDKMRKVDPAVDALLHPIISGVAAMEGEDAAEMARRFSLRTGVSV
jgi:hypothetical protein